jgi:hypothetical protein
MPTPTLFHLAHGLLLSLCLVLPVPASSSALSITPVALPGQAQGSVLATDEGFLLSWIDRDGATAALRFAELDAQGNLQRQGDVASGTQWFVNWADFPSLVIAENGDWLAFVLVKSDPSKPYAYDIHTTRSTDRGSSWSPLAVLHDDGTSTEHGFVSLLADGNDRILAVWLDGRRSVSQAAEGQHGHDHGGAQTALHSAVITREGVIERRELDSLTCDCCRTSLARGTEGPVAVYRDRSSDEIRDLFEVSRSERIWSSPKPLPADHWTMPGCPVNGPALIRQGGDLLAAWSTQIDATPTLRLARRENDQWTLLPDLDRGEQLTGRVDLAPWREHTSLAIWLGEHRETQGQQALKLAELDADGRRLSQQVIVVLPAGRSPGMPRIAAHDGRALAVWTTSEQGVSKLSGALIRDR